MIIPPQIQELADAIEAACDDDREVNIPVFENGVVTGSNGTNSFEAHTIMQAVLAMLENYGG